MFKYVLGILCILAIMAGVVTVVMAQSRPAEYIWNAVWNSSTSTIKIVGQ